MPETAPEHWRIFRGPANWFSLRHPPGWRTEERDGTCALYPPDTSALVTINSIWSHSETVAPLPTLEEIAQQFPGVRAITPLGESTPGLAATTLQGEAVLEEEPVWWKRILQRPRWRAWTMWQLQRPQLRLVVTLIHDGPRDQDLESMTRMILNYLELPDVPADPPEVFALRVLALAKKTHPQYEIALQQDFHLKISSVQLNLANFYRSYIRSPGEFEEIVLPILSTAVKMNTDSAEKISPSLEQVHDQLMPMLYCEQSWKDHLPDICGTPWIAGLVILYVVDEESTYWYVRKDLVDEWNLSLDELHEISLENLESHVEQSPIELGVIAEEHGPAAMIMPHNVDAFNASRLLSETFLRHLRELAEGDLAVGVPGRDFFVAVSSRVPTMIDRVRRRVSEDFTQTDHPLTDRLLFVSADGVSELIDDDGN